MLGDVQAKRCLEDTHPPPPSPTHTHTQACKFLLLSWIPYMLAGDITFKHRQLLEL